MSDQVIILGSILADWADGIREHRPEAVAALFAGDAVFQGFDRAHTVGRPAVAAYYDKQPVGLDVQYRIQESRSFGEDAFIAFVDVDFIRPSGEVIPTHLTLALVRTGGEWLIQQYHVSKIDA
ncbi:SgcJ/EcaC family oxidoreductase [Leifsonia sp. fls2-241-R2A-40a]|uniref:SgcJ/EcaC family oxidoreductase n=1 Tax=Leifsonia sp. fls2-241-R2A-40a TaxID=3040290 RepID=UPI00254D1819|nr:SgcJ/EcaC family oxidoreductase [Leifsonia sp. fls2-241-R2A-40a]